MGRIKCAKPSASTDLLSQHITSVAPERSPSMKFTPKKTSWHGHGPWTWDVMKGDVLETWLYRKDGGILTQSHICILTRSMRSALVVQNFV
jgi:hypothetical protein